MNRVKLKDKKNEVKAFKFLLYSFIGVFMFFIPIKLRGSRTIPIDHLVNMLKALPYYEPIYGGVLIIIGAIFPFVNGTWNKDRTTTVFSMLNILGVIFLIMLIFNIGPYPLLESDMISFIYKNIVIPVTTIIPIGSIFLAFIMNYGLMELIGVLMRPIMKPIWKTPGRSAIDAVTAFVGSYSVALLITNRAYKEGKYTEREASIIGSGFTTVAVTIMIIVAKTSGIIEHWTFYFLFTLAVTFTVTAITSRIYPLNRKPETYYKGKDGDIEPDLKGNPFKIAWQEAMAVLNESSPLLENIWRNLKDGIRLAISIAPNIISIGVLGLIIANYTPLFDILGYLFYPITLILRIPEPLLAAKASAISISEMLLPAVVVAEAPLVTRFIIAVVSVSEILFFSASIPCILSTEIPLTLKDIMIIWVQRVILSLVIAGPILLLIL